MSKYDSPSRPASQPLLTIQISRLGGVMILTALALIAVLIDLDLRGKGRAQAAPKAADDTVEVAESKSDAAPLAPEPLPSDGLTGEGSTGQRAPVYVMQPVPTQDTVESASSRRIAYSSVAPSLQPASADASRNDSNDSNDPPQPATPSTPAAAHDSRLTESKSPQEIKGPLNVAGAGATFPYPIYAKWFTKFREDVRDQGVQVQIKYNAVGSGGGIHQLLDGKVDFGATDIPMSDEQMSQVEGKILHLPTVLRAVVPIYNIPGVTGEVRFTPEVLADIYLGKIATWDDEAIARENPHKHFPNQEIIVVHRSDGDSATYLFTDFLSKVSTEWRSSVGLGPSVKWPKGLGAKGDEGVADSVHQLDGAIGYVDMRFAKESGLAMGSVRNLSGKFVPATMESLMQAAASTPNMPPDFRISITNAPGAKAYPITGFTWLLVPIERKNGPRRGALIAFLGWMLDHGETMTTGLDYAPLPSNISDEVRQGIARLH